MVGVAVPVSDDVLRVGRGRRVGYRLSGADTRPALLYLHGAPSSRAEVGDYEPGLLEEREQLKETYGSGVLDWGPQRHRKERYEAYWRGMSIGLFPTAAEAVAYLEVLG